METTTLDPSFNAALQYFLPVIMAALSVLGAEAYKYMFTPLWDTKIFLKTNAMPLVLNIGLALGVYFLLIYAPIMKPVLESLGGEAITISAAGIFGFSQAVIKGLLQRKKTIEDIEVTE